jgi:hypothetical protein
MTINIDFSTIDNIINNVGGFIFAFVEFIKIIFNNITFLLLFLFFIGMIYAMIRFFDFKRHNRNIERNQRKW